MALAASAALADDLVQDSIEKALLQASQLRDLQHLAGWLRRILYRLYMDEIRRKRRHGTEQDIGELVNLPELSEPALDNMGGRDFMRAMSALSPEHREILLLVGLEGLSYREIAEELRIPAGTVMSRLARARERLREMMEGGAALSKEG